MPVGSLEENTLPVDIDQCILYSNIPESVLGRKGHLLLTVLPLYHMKCIQRRSLGRPQLQIFQVKRNIQFTLCLYRPVRNLLHTFCHGIPLRIQ